MVYNLTPDFTCDGDSMNLNRFNNLDRDELLELASNGIGLRIALRSSGKIQDDLKASLFNEQQDLYLLSDNELKEKINFHSKALHNEKNSS